MAEKTEVLNVKHPDDRGSVDAATYRAMKAALLKALAGLDGLSQTDLHEAVKPQLPDDPYPHGKAAGWWSKTVQLDLEARGKMGRSDTKPLMFHLK